MNNFPYSAKVIEHFENPCNVMPQGTVEPGPESVRGEGGAVSGGVWIAFELEIDQHIITRARFRAYGCPHTVALASWLTDRLVGERLNSSYTLNHEEVVAELKLPTAKMRSVLVAEDALRACANQLNSKEAS